VRSLGPYPVCRNLRNNAIPLKEANRAEGVDRDREIFYPFKLQETSCNNNGRQPNDVSGYEKGVIVDSDSSSRVIKAFRDRGELLQNFEKEPHENKCAGIVSKEPIS